MATITIKFLAAVQTDLDQSVVQIEVNNDATCKDLQHHLQRLGVDLDARDAVIVLNGRGLRQWPAERKVKDGDQLIVFPLISGG